MYIGYVLKNPRHHLTLTFHGHNETKEQYKGAVTSLAQAARAWDKPIEFTTGAIELFVDSHAWHTKVESQTIRNFRGILGFFLEQNGVEYSKDFEFTPHITLTYFGSKPPKNPYAGLTLFVDRFSVVSNEFGNTEVLI